MRRAMTPVPRVLLFDLDDTLCDYASARAMRLRTAFGPALETLPPEGRPNLDELIADSLATHPHGSAHFPELLRRHGVEDSSAATAAVAWYQANKLHSLALFDDAVETLRTLRAALPGRRIGLVTNGPADIQREKIILLEVAALVDFVIISGEFGVWKPEPAIFQEALRLADAEAHEAVFIGDSPEYDMAGARAAGIRSIWLNRNGGVWPLNLPPPDDEVTSLADLLDLLNRRKGAGQ